MTFHDTPLAWGLLMAMEYPAATPDERMRAAAEYAGWTRLDPIPITDLIPNYRSPRPPADKLIANAIEATMREARPPFAPPCTCWPRPPENA